MAWKSVWINPQKEPSYWSFTLVLTSPTGDSFRVDKVFPPAEMSKEEFDSAAAKEIEILELELNPPAVQPEIIEE